MNELVFMGMLLSEKGVGPTESHVKAIVEAREPRNAAEVDSFLGLINFSSRFILHCSTICEPLSELGHTDVKFEFGL